ncbi:unnamed protein product [Ilex paraguariensis]|uniref:Uncharacterized protein n=1 Tax=Ilex paraguariensis TaxID=185542 RepID=A0ABC8QQG9_9AQUA
MPGTIRVSVLEFDGLSSSSPPSSLSIKVSMGKREYQTWDKGDFSFPLTTLRDNLIVTLQDAEGNDISHTGVQTMSVVQKGMWDDIFLLEGGGHVHMKLQFILSEEERNRVRVMRESAMKKKQGKTLNTNLKSSETSTSVGGSVASSLSINQDISDSQTSVVPAEAVNIGDVTMQAGPLSQLDNQTTPSAADRSEVTLYAPVLQEVEENLTEFHQRALVEKLETHLPHADLSTIPLFGQGASTMLECSESDVAASTKPVSPKLDDDLANKTEKQGPLEKTPSNVRKMISAFESSVSQVFIMLYA